MIAFKEKSLTSAMNIKQGMEQPSTNAIDDSLLENSKPKQPSPSSFLSNLKEFNIENTKYRHYGNLMTSQQLERIVDHGSIDKETSRQRISSKSSKMLSYSNHLSSPLASPPEHISKALELPANKLYSEAIISQMLLLRTEQEKTRQTQEKIQLGKVVAQLLEEAKALGIGSKLIHRLFLDEDSEEYKSHVIKLRSQSDSGNFYVSEEVHPQTADPLKPRSPIYTMSPKQLMDNSPETLKEMPKFTGSNLNSQNGNMNTQNTTQQIPVITPVRTEQNIRISSESTKDIPKPVETWGPRTETRVAPLSNLLPRPQNSPPMPPNAQPVYPVYYQVPETYFQQRKLSQTQSHTGSEKGLPHLNHKNPGGLNQPPSHFAPINNGVPQNKEQQNMAHFNGGFLKHGQEQQVYFMNSLPPCAGSGPPIMGPQYFALPPLTPAGPVVWQGPPVHERKWEEEETYVHKKRRGSKNGISFMINTPKNPPARKCKKRAESS